MIDGHTMRRVMGCFPTGVTVVAATVRDFRHCNAVAGEVGDEVVGRSGLEKNSIAFACGEEAVQGHRPDHSLHPRRKLTGTTAQADIEIGVQVVEIHRLNLWRAEFFVNEKGGPCGSLLLSLPIDRLRPLQGTYMVTLFGIDDLCHNPG